MSENTFTTPARSPERFQQQVGAFFEKHLKPWAHAIFQVYRDSKGDVICVKILSENVGANFGTAAVLMHVTGQDGYPDFESAILDGDRKRKAYELLNTPFRDDGKHHANTEILRWAIREDIELGVLFCLTEDHVTRNPPANLTDVHFRLALLSRRHFEPNQLNINGMFGLLPILVYTNFGNCYTVDDWNRMWYEKIYKGEIPTAIDKCGLLSLMGPIPTDVRICNPAMIREGAHIGSGTTVMHYGFVNHNAGTTGPAMVEGRISAGTVAGQDTDFGAGSGCMGTLSGGGNIVVRTGRRCLIGAQAQLPIPIGDDVCISAGLVFTANTPVAVVEWETDDDGKFLTGKDGQPIEIGRKIMKAIELSGIKGVTFRRNSQTGAIEVIPVPNKVTLNSLLHQVTLSEP